MSFFSFFLSGTKFSLFFCTHNAQPFAPNSHRSQHHGPPMTRFSSGDRISKTNNPNFVSTTGDFPVDSHTTYPHGCTRNSQSTPADEALHYTNEQTPSSVPLRHTSSPFSPESAISPTTVSLTHYPSPSRRQSPPLSVPLRRPSSVLRPSTQSTQTTAVNTDSV